MHYPGIIALLVSSFGVVVTAFVLQFMNSALPQKERYHTPAWIIIVALLLFGVALLGLRRMAGGDGQILIGFALTATMLAGNYFKWVCETIAQKKLVLHESVLAKSMLAAGLSVVLFGGPLFAPRYLPGAFLLWFLNGYFWHALFSDIERVTARERIVIRRREPPTLPYDYRKPTIE